MRAATKRGLTLAWFSLLLVPASASANFDVAISHTDLSDPVARGGSVTYTTTLTNEGTEVFEGVGLNLYGLGVGTSKAVPNPYESTTPSQGECLLEPAGDYQQAVCSLGPLAPGASARVTSVVQANVSTDNVAGLLRCDFGPDSCTATSDQDPADDQVTERTTVIVAPQVSGSAKVMLEGLPEGCVDGDTRIKAKAKGKKVKEINAKLIGRNVSERLGRSTGNKLTFTLPGSELEQARLYELNVNVTRKGAAGLKRTVELQAC